jgi:glutathione S-transferase
VARQVTNGLFPVLAKCIKNLDRTADSEMLSAIMSELSAVDAQLQKSGGPYLCGKELTVADCSYAPKLYHAKTTLAQVLMPLLLYCYCCYWYCRLLLPQAATICYCYCWL